MFSLIGLGLNPRQLTLEALHAIQASDSAWVEGYTSMYAEGNLEGLEGIVHRKLSPIGRSDIEEGMKGFLSRAQQNHIALLVYGNPLTATTHISLIQECVRQRIPYQVIPGVSVFDYRGVCGLDEYKFGRTTTFVFPEEGHEPLSPFDIIVKNKSMGLHTHCLFDLHPEKQRMMRVDEAISFILKAGEARRVVVHEWVGVGLGGMGSPNPEIRAARLGELQKQNWEKFPQSLIVCGDMNAHERDALRALGGWGG
ncbi:MAG: diphthine synthase [Candidatus Diapherotrites archaeon]|nr:diphthine synthase [Candidatus Diapherotrites archaeon]MDZ4256868.1 diphthine synthase [archaeon]